MRETGGAEHSGWSTVVGAMLFRVLCPPTGDGHGRTTDEPAQGLWAAPEDAMGTRYGAAVSEEGRVLKEIEAPRPHTLLYVVPLARASAEWPFLGLPGGHF